MTVPLDLRLQIAEAVAAKKGSIRELAERFAVSRSTVEKIIARVRETGSAAPRPHGGGARSLLDEAQRATLRELVATQPDATLGELADALAKAVGVRVSIPTMSRMLRVLGLPHRKRPRGRSS